MSKVTWGSLSVGDCVELAGRVLEVVEAKPKPKKRAVDITVRDKLGSFSKRMPANDKVKLAKLHEVDHASGSDRQQRWATKAEAAETDRREGLPAGDPTITKRPTKPTGGPWDKPKGAAEKAIEEILGAHLVGESNDEDAGYYVPPADEQTIAAHSLIFHGEVLTLEQHVATHATRDPLKVNHWHTKERP